MVALVYRQYACVNGKNDTTERFRPTGLHSSIRWSRRYQNESVLLLQGFDFRIGFAHLVSLGIYRGAVSRDESYQESGEEPDDKQFTA